MEDKEVGNCDICYPKKTQKKMTKEQFRVYFVDQLNIKKLEIEKLNNRIKANSESFAIQIRNYEEVVNDLKAEKRITRNAILFENGWIECHYQLVVEPNNQICHENRYKKILMVDASTHYHYYKEVK